MAKLVTEKGSGSLHLKVLLEGEVFPAEKLYFAIWGWENVGVMVEEGW